MSTPPVVVFVAHAADRTGPPVLLLQQLRWLRAHAEWEVHVVLLRGGELLDAFAEVAPTTVVGEPAVGPLPDPGARAAEAARRARRQEQLAPLAPVDLVYLNTAWSIHGLSLIPDRPGRRVLAAIHELDHDLRDGMPPASLRALLERPDHLLAGAPVIGRTLVDGYGVPADRITVVPEAIAIPAEAPAPARAELGLPDGAVVVVGAGRPAGRKGTDLFVHAAWHLRRDHPDLDVRFVWLGIDPDDPDARTAAADVERLGLAGTVELRPPTDRPLDHFRAADLLLLPSREDASPLVALEAAAVGTPVVCFALGGTPDLVGRDEAGVVVPYPDVPALADAVAALARDPAERARRGAVAAARVRQHHDIERAGPRLLAAIERWLP